MKKIFIICSVRNADEEYRRRLENYTKSLEEENCIVHLPHRDTNQLATGFEICSQNREAIKNADEVHVFYSSSSLGTHFDLGVAFAFNKKIVVVESEQFDEKKSFAKMIWEWTTKQAD